jgi:hypothetical protein
MLQNLPRAAALSLALVLTAILAASSLAGGSTLKTLHFYTNETSFTYTAPNGKHPTPPANPKPGASFDETDVAYAGTFKKHARIATGSSHLHCLYQAAGHLDCDSQIAINGALILAHGDAHIAMTIVGEQPNSCTQLDGSRPRRPAAASTPPSSTTPTTEREPAFQD